MTKVLFLLGPLLLSAIGLSADFFGGWRPNFLSSFLLPLEVLYPVVVYFACEKDMVRMGDLRPTESALLAPLVLTPLGLLSAWTTAPGLFAFGGPRYFLSWLTRYPNFGPINLEVLLGLTCLLGVTLIPVLYSGYRLKTQRPSQWPVVLAVVAQLVFYLPLYSQIDRNLLGAFTLALRHGGESLPLLDIASEASGAFYRLTATLCLLWALARGRVHRGKSTDEQPSL